MTDRASSFKLIKARALVDGTGNEVIEQAAILIENDLIAAVGTQNDVRPPDGADVVEINYPDQTVLPGLVDCHVHLIGFGDGRAGDDLTLLPDEVLTLQAARNARTHLDSGVTTVRDCGAKNRTTLMLREAMNLGVAVGPRLVLSGRPMAIVGGHLSYFGVEVTGVDESRAAVRQLVKEGVDFIKITATGGSTKTSFSSLASFNVEELTAICDEAHSFGKHTAAHCTSTQGIANAVDAGVDTIIHAIFNEPDGSRKFDPVIAERIAKQGVYVNPTLMAAGYGAGGQIELLEQKRDSESLTNTEQSWLDQLYRTRDESIVDYAAMREAGITMVSGSDSAWSNFKMGRFQAELEANVSSGMTPMEAIVSGTADSAKSSWVYDNVGSLDVGKKADILVVNGDPTTDIKALSNVAEVYKDGIRVDRQINTV
jgi:imidazolonepropionase-like amidohydrolase